MLRDVERASNPWGKAQSERADWAAELGVRVLEPGDPRARVPVLGRLRVVVRRARARDGRVDREAAAEGRASTSRSSGPREACTGDPARRMGNEYVFQAFAEQNVATLNEAGVTKIVANCPHCFNTLGERVPRLRRQLRGRPPLRAARAARARRPAGSLQRDRRPVDHLPRLLLPGAPQRRARRRRASWSPPSASRSRWSGQRQADVLLRRRRRAHVDGGARRARSTTNRVREAAGDRRRHARGRVSVLHGDARRRRPERRRAAARRRRRDAARRGGPRVRDSRPRHRRQEASNVGRI